ncbi:MAG TPA: hypothetical protein VLD62_06440 [Acidimicrobiia bacterium]|nr:hypothetical protein [Acidimicrobiia bacterium]
MSEWGWVSLGYSATYGAIVLYGLWTLSRLRRARRNLEQASP